MKTAELRVTDTAGNHQFAIVDDSKGQDIAIVYNRDEESKKTAQLLAAAPDMIAALKQFIHAAEHEGVINGRLVCAVRNANEAIQKATNP